MSDPQLPPVPPTAPNGNSTNPPQPPQQQQFASAPPAASALPANPQYPAAPPYGTPQPPYAQQAPQQAPAYGQPQAQPQPPAQPQPYGQQAPQHSAYAHPGAAPYASTQQQQPAYGAAPATTRPAGSTNTLARVAFIIALAVAAIGALQVLVQPFLLSSIGYYSGYGAGGFGVFTLLFGIVSFLASAAALVLGLIAVRRTGGQVFAGIAIGVGGVQLLGIVLGWISSLFYAFL